MKTPEDFTVIIIKCAAAVFIVSTIALYVLYLLVILPEVKRSGRHGSSLDFLFGTFFVNDLKQFGELTKGDKGRLRMFYRISLSLFTISVLCGVVIATSWAWGS